MSMEEFERGDAPPGTLAMQTTMCVRTGQFFVRPIDGRYRGHSRGDLEDRRDQLRAVIDAFGGDAHYPPDTPLWQQVETLENVLDFETALPCGCGERDNRNVAHH